MRISPVCNNYSFKGIKVNRLQNNKTENRQEQRDSIEFLDAQIMFYDSIAKRLGKDSVPKEIEDFSSEKISDSFDAQSSRIDDIETMLKPFNKVALRKFDAANSAIRTIHRADLRKIEELRESERIRASNHNTANEKLDRIAGYDYEKQVLMQEFINPVEKEKKGENIDIVGSVLFFGPYNNGKTTITESVAQATNCPIIIRTASTDKDNFFEEIKKEAVLAEQNFSETNQRTIIFIDELDNLINEKSPVNKDFVEFIKTCSKKYHCTLFAATNNPRSLGIDLKDPDIFPIKMSIDPPNRENKLKLFQHYLKGFPKTAINYQVLLDAIEDEEYKRDGKYTNGQIEQICKQIGENLYYKELDTRIILDYFISDNMEEPEINVELESKFIDDYEYIMT